RQWRVASPQVEVGDAQRLSSPVTAARQRRTFTGLPATHPQPSRCLEGCFNYSGAKDPMQGFQSKIPKISAKSAVKRRSD
ncbi:hypothetical protein, partial [Fervidibacter sp.]